MAAGGSKAMSDSHRAALLEMLVAGYADLKRRLTRRLGSADLAAEAMQDTFVRVACANIGPVRRPRAYLFRVALNVAADRRRVERRHRGVCDADAVLDAVDDTPGPARTVEARSDIDALKRAIAALPARRHDILMAFLAGVAQRAIARRLDISVRTVQVEIKLALQYCAACLGHDVPAAPRPDAEDIPPAGRG